MAATYTARINAVDRAETHVLLDGFKINEVTNGINTLVCRVGSEDASYRPLKRQTIEIEEDDGTSPVRLIFGGTLRMVREHGWGMTADGDDSIILELSADSYKTLASRRFVTETIPAGTLKAALQVLEPYLTAYGVTLDPAQANGPTLEAIEFKVVRVDDCLNFLATLSAKYGAPFIWAIGYDKVLGMYQTGTVAAPWNLIESEFTTLESSTGDIEVEPTDDNYANKIILVWGNGNVIDLGFDGLNTPEQFVGDGVTNSFPLKYRLLGPIPGNNVGAIGYGFVNVPGPAIAPLGSIGTANMEWEYDPVTNSVSRVAGAPALGFAFSVPYRGELRGEVIALDAGEIAANGLWEDKILATEIEDPVLAQSMAEAELARRIATGRIVRFMTRRMPAPVPGDSLTITVPKRNISGTFNVTDVATENDPGNVNALIRTVTCNSSIHEQYHQTLTRWWSEKDTTGIAAPAGASAVPGPPLYSVQSNRPLGRFFGEGYVNYYELFWGGGSVNGLNFPENPGVVLDPRRMEMGNIQGDFSMDQFGGGVRTGVHPSSILMNSSGSISLTAGTGAGAELSTGQSYWGGIRLNGGNSLTDSYNEVGGFFIAGGFDPGFSVFPGPYGDSVSLLEGLTLLASLGLKFHRIDGVVASLPFTIDTDGVSDTQDFSTYISTAGTGTITLPAVGSTGSPNYHVWPVDGFGRTLLVVNHSAGTLTVSGGGSTVNGAASIALGPMSAVIVQRFNTTATGEWAILSSHGSVTGGGGGGGGTPGGDDKDVQFNDGGVFGGENAFEYDKTKDQLSLTDSVGTYSPLRLVKSGNNNAVTSIRPQVSYSEITFGREVVANTDTARTANPGYLWWNDGGFGSPAVDGMGLELELGETPDSAMTYALARGIGIGHDGLFRVYQAGGLGTGAFTGCGIEVDRNDDNNGAAAYLSLQRRGGTRDYLWVDNTGAFRIGSAPPQEDGTPSDTSGTVLGGAVTTLTALAADPGAPSDNDSWIRVTGTSPNQIAEWRIRLSGTTYTAFSYGPV